MSLMILDTALLSLPGRVRCLRALAHLSALDISKHCNVALRSQRRQELTSQIWP